VGLDAFHGLFDLVEGVLFLAEEAEGEIFFVGIAARIGLVHAESGTAAFTSFAEAVFGYTLDLIENMVTKFGQFDGLAL
jgi:hypothetical protein